jgi:hypothetical protein
MSGLTRSFARGMEPPFEGFDQSTWTEERLHTTNFTPRLGVLGDNDLCQPFGVVSHLTIRSLHHLETRRLLPNSRWCLWSTISKATRNTLDVEEQHT